MLPILLLQPSARRVLISEVLVALLALAMAQRVLLVVQVLFSTQEVLLAKAATSIWLIAPFVQIFRRARHASLVLLLMLLRPIRPNANYVIVLSKDVLAAAVKQHVMSALQAW